MDSSLALETSQSVTGRSVALKGRPPYLLPLWLLTGIYLTFELAFNSRLLDVSGGLTQPDQVNAIEHWGRYISGTALALLVWGVGVMPRGVHRRWSVEKWTVILAVTAIVSITFVYNFEKQLIDQLTDRSSGEARRAAVILQLFSHSILQRDLNVDGIDLSPDVLERPEGKTFIALFPVLSFSTNDLNRKAEAALRQVIRNAVSEKIGSAQGFYSSTFQVSRKKILQAFNNQYRAGANRMHHTLDDIPDTQASAWDDYVRDLARHGYRPETVPWFGYGRVRSSVQAKGVPVPYDWVPRDKTTFFNVLREKIEGEASAQYRQSIQSQFGQGAYLPDDLQWESFCSHPLIQKKWRDELKLPDDVVLTPGMSFGEYTKIAYDPIVDRAVDEQLAFYQAAPETFEADEKNSEVGRAAMEALLVPPIALGFSLMGALGHTFKFTLLTSHIVSPWRRLNRILVGLFVLGIAMVPFFAPNEITTSPVYGYFEQQTSGVLSRWAATPLTWVIQAQPFAYPLNEWVRTHPLGGMSFGYDPAARPVPQVQSSTADPPLVRTASVANPY